MTCPYSNTNKQTNCVTMSFHRRELLHDIQNYSFVDGEILPDEAQCIKHLLQDILEPGNIDRVNRMLDLGYTECLDALYPYTKVDVKDGESTDDKQSTTDVYVIEMNVPEGYSRTTLSHLTNLIHEYLVCRVVGDWGTIANPQGSALWLHKLADIKLKIEESLHRRTGRTRRKVSPF